MVRFIADALGWKPSRFRWHRGQGVTIASAPRSLASDVCLATMATELGSLIVRMGKPQHLVLPVKSTTSAPSYLYHPLKGVLPLRVLIEAQGVGGTDDVAAVEGRYLHTAKRSCGHSSSASQGRCPQPVSTAGAWTTTVFLNSSPSSASVRLTSAMYSGSSVRRLWAWGHRSLAGAANGHNGQAHGLRHREGAGVQGVAPASGSSPGARLRLCRTRPP